MSAEPSEEDVQTVQMILSNISRDEALRKLKANGNSVERAINAAFEGATAQADNTWDESAFHSDRADYEFRDQNVPSFTIHGADSLQSNIFSAAPSRPPSRMGDQGGADAAPEQPSVDANKSLSREQREEQELQQAMALSMSEHYPQESGVTNSTGAQFGPAQRDFYDTNQWALTTVSGPSAHEIILNPDPAERKRLPPQPAFMKPSPSGRLLAPMFTIIQTIPLVREALLMRDHLLADYGHDSEWWDGTPIRVSKVTHLSNPYTDNDLDEVIHEAQRMTAFLELTDRSYGSVETLAKNPAIMTQNLDEVLPNFLKVWDDTANMKPEYSMGRIFGSQAVKVAANSDQSAEEVDKVPFTVLDVTLFQDNLVPNATLYDALDEFIWSDSVNESVDDQAYLTYISDVVTLRIEQHRTEIDGIGVRVPVSWYPDRYMEANTELAKAMRAQKIELSKSLKDINSKQDKLMNMTLPNGKVIDGRKLLQQSIQYLVPSSTSTDAAETGGDVHMESQRSAPGSDIKGRLDLVCDRITDKLRLLDEQAEKARATLKELSSLLTQPREGDPRLSPKNLYHLRGVSTSPSVTYMLYPVDEESKASATPDAMTRGLQWWKLSYSSSESQPVEKARVSEKQVLKAARDESKKVLLVYASDRACQFQAEPLPAQLQKFVEADNRAFAAELAEDAQPAPDPDAAARASPKRKTRPDADDMDQDEPPSRRAPSPPSGYREKPTLVPLVLHGQPVDPDALPTHEPPPYEEAVAQDSGGGGAQEMQERKGSGGLVAQMAGGSGGAKSDGDEDLMDLNADESTIDDDMTG